jgi:hypothetical protein
MFHAANRAAPGSEISSEVPMTSANLAPSAAATRRAQVGEHPLEIRIRELARETEHGGSRNAVADHGENVCVVPTVTPVTIEQIGRVAQTLPASHVAVTRARPDEDLPAALDLRGIGRRRRGAYRGEQCRDEGRATSHRA